MQFDASLPRSRSDDNLGDMLSPGKDKVGILTLETVCEALNSGDDITDFPPDTDWFKLAKAYAARFEGADKYQEYDSVEVMCPGISGQFLDMVLEV